MGSVWSVKPETERLELEWTDDVGDVHPFWLEVKKRLNVGEDRKMTTAGFKSMSTAADVDSDGKRAADKRTAEINVDWQAQSFARSEIYITDWSLTDDKSVKLRVCREVIETFHPELFKVIEDGITRHVEAMVAAKKARAGAGRPSAMSA